MGHFQKISWIIFFCTGCASIKLVEKISPTPQDKPSLSALLSAQETVDGGFLWIKYEKTEKVALLKAEFENNEIPFFPESPTTYYSYFGVPFNHPPGLFQISIKYKEGDQEKMLGLPLKINAGNYPSEILKVDPKQVHPSLKDLKRIKKESTEVGLIYKKILGERFWKTTFHFPITTPITSPYGTKRIYNGELQSFHSGLDLKAPEGTPIYSSAPGIVALAKNLFVAGNAILLNHGYGIFTLYAHLQKINVKKGEKISENFLIGYSGKTGRANGPHLHWGAIVNRVKINPIELTKLNMP